MAWAKRALDCRRPNGGPRRVVGRVLGGTGCAPPGGTGLLVCLVKMTALGNRSVA